MQPIRFIHAADLHLDTAFSGLSREAPAELTSRLKDATFVALRRLLDLCAQERPDFLVLSGDIYNQEDKSLPAQLALHDGCVRLRELGIPVFIAHGNHDPLSSCLKTLHWPDNVTLFGEEVQAFPVVRRSSESLAPIAVVHGVSHATSRETRNLAARFNRTQDGTFAEPSEIGACLHVGVLHATPGTASATASESGNSTSNEPRYAPFSLEDLANAGMDYWALGHIHDRREICRKPLALYSGCTQGLHINEPGEKGCLLVTAQPETDGSFTLTTAFRPLGPVVWLTLDVPLEDENDTTQNQVNADSSLNSDSLERQDNAATSNPSDAAALADNTTADATECSLDALESRLRAALDTASEHLWSGCEALIVRLRLTGRTGLDALLRRGSTCTELVDRLRDAPLGDPGSGPFIWIKDMDVSTRPRLDRATLLEREDLLGEILRVAEASRDTPEGLTELRDNALTKLFGDSRARKALEPLTETEMARLLDDAESLCMDLLEND